jgi:two-component system alkaline phosphatase synthesis response regulator PhoP
MHSPDVVVTRKKLLKDVWNFEEDCETRTLDMHIKSIRRKLANYSNETYIETIRGIGFVINGKTI